jgi:hypothetical protein
MGNLCCGPREVAGPVGSRLAGGTSEAARFDVAYRNLDFKELINLMKNGKDKCKLDKKMHPWGTQPTTYSCLAATCLAVVASQCGQGKKSVFSFICFINFNFKPMTAVVSWYAF